MIPMNDELRVEPSSEGMTDLLTIGFGTTVAMWTVAFLCRLPPAYMPSPAVAILMLLCLFAGGFWGGRCTGRGWKGGAFPGGIAAVLNLLILGSLLGGDSPNAVRPQALWWIPGWFLASVCLGGIGGVVGTSSGASRPWTNWTHSFINVTMAATFLLLVVGGLVTSNEAGLAVVDWPNSFGYNMFLYPLSRMTGGVFYEHSHRLIGSLVGLTTLVAAILLFRKDSRSWMKVLVSIAVLAVVIQGIMGGLRVTGTFTLSTSPEDTSPSLLLAVVHGVFGQLFFTYLGVLSVLTSTSWINGRPASDSPSRRLDSRLAICLFLLLVPQLILGALQRHFGILLMWHLTFAGFVALLAFILGIRVGGLYDHEPLVKRWGGLLLAVTALQILLGFGALVTIVPLGDGHTPQTPLQVLLATAHQAVGAILLVTAASLLLWLRREASSRPEGMQGCSL
jgi:cytochrome c oxidase assembly protein subunit 15